MTALPCSNWSRFDPPQFPSVSLIASKTTNEGSSTAAKITVAPITLFCSTAIQAKETGESRIHGEKAGASGDT